jgi:riboflavin transporter FmnP
MQLIPFLYLLLIPFLVIASVVYAKGIKSLLSKSVLQVMNILLLIYAAYQIRLLIGLIQFLRSISNEQSTNDFWMNYIDQSVIRTLVSILLPLCFVVPFFRKSLWFSLGVMVYYLDITELPDFALIDWISKSAQFLSWFSLVYALFWLKKWLPVNQIQS